jgi:SAM-dependent methyltransferase
VRQIIRFNWPLYAVAAVVVLLAPVVIPQLPVRALARGMVYAALGLGPFWIVGSVLVSWFVYDHSPLMTGTWIPRALGVQPRAWLNIHAGFDEWTPVLHALVGTPGRTLDVFDPREMTEPSIARAREATPFDSEPADFRHLPARTGTIDAVFFLLSAHELRTHQARCTLFADASRVLVPGGRIVVAEHVRDWANFLAFGPGFLHFYSHRAWTRCFADAGLAVHEEFSITPFVRVFVLRRLS